MVDRTATVISIASINVAAVTAVIAFFLPLKIILLVGSEGVPRYFQFFIAKDSKGGWVGGLAMATFAFYFLSLWLDNVADRYSGRASRNLLRGADQVPLVADEEGFAATTYRRVTESVAKLIFAAMALTVGLALYPQLFAFIGLLLLLEFLALSYVLRRQEPKSALGRYVLNNTNQFLKLLSSGNFLGMFLFLLTAFLAFAPPNLLVAIASIMISRQLFGTVTAFVKNARRLSRDRATIDALLFEERQLWGSEGEQVEAYRRALEPERRLERVRRAAMSPGAEPGLSEVTESRWVDSGDRKMALFDLYTPSANGRVERSFREYVYTPSGSKGLVHQDYLMDMVCAGELPLLSRAARIDEASFSSRIIHYREIESLPPGQWEATRRAVLLHLWRWNVPPKLVRSYVAAHPLLHERVDEALVARLALAGDEPWAEAAYASVRAALNDLQERVGGLPLFLWSGKLSRRNAVRDVNNRLYLLDWRSWTLEPVGVGFSLIEDSLTWLEGAIEELRERGDFPEEAGIADLLGASLLHHIESAVQNGQPKEALKAVQTYLPLLALSDNEILVQAQAWQAQDQNGDSDNGATDEARALHARAIDQ